LVIKPKDKIIFYTDCFIYGGCEKTLFNLIGSQAFKERFDYHLIYRSSRAYRQGLHSHGIKLSPQNVTAVHFPDKTTWAFFLEHWLKNQISLRLVKALIMIMLDLLKPLFFVYELLGLSALFARIPAQIVHVNNGGYPGALSCLAAVVAAKLVGKRQVILTVNNIALKPRGVVERVIDLFVKRSLDIAVTGSQAAAAALRDNRGFCDQQIVSIHHGIKPPQLVVSKRCRNMVMIARFERRKGHSNVLLAFKRLLNQRPEYANVRLVLIGSGPLLDNIKALAQAEDLTANVDFLGHRHDYLDYLANSLLLLNPSTGSEDFPYIIVEAMSLGIPVVGTYVAGIPEQIEDQVSGLLVPAGDIAALSTAMQTLLSQEQLLVKMGAAAKQRFDRLFTLDVMIKKYCNLYAGLIKQTGGPLNG
jgi:glycosyltransferase involved in cell wall biosynthesis